MKIFIHWPKFTGSVERYFYIADHTNFRFMLSPDSGFTWYVRLPGGLFLDHGLGPDEYDELLWELGPFHLVREGFPPEDEY